MSQLLNDNAIELNRHGFTIIEVILVLIVIGIISAVVVGHYINTQELDLASQTDTIRTHLRYAHTRAMRHSNIWGIKCDNIDYWLFRTNDPDTGTNQVSLPGEDSVKITLSDKNVNMDAFTLFFDGYGIPYTAYIDESNNTPVSSANPLLIQITPEGASSPTQTIKVTPETGFLQ